MNHFLDSNVIIGYISCLDDLFDNSKEVISYNEDNFYSENVKQEVNQVFGRKSDEYSKFIMKLTKKLNQFDNITLISSNEFHSYINSLNNIGHLGVSEMHITFDKMWNIFDFGENQEVMLVKFKFDEFLNELDAFNLSRKKDIFNRLILVPNHTKKDRKIMEKIKENNLREGLLHFADEEILFDANEFCKYNPELKLKFVTADQNLIKVINILMEYLCLDECINLKEFSNS